MGLRAPLTPARQALNCIQGLFVTLFLQIVERTLQKHNVVKDTQVLACIFYIFFFPTANLLINPNANTN